MLSLGTTVEHDLNARVELARQRAVGVSGNDIFSASWADLLVTPSRTPTSPAQETNQEFEVAGSLTEANFSANLRSSALEFLGTTADPLRAPVLAPTSSAAQRLVEAAQYVDGKLAEDARKVELAESERRQRESASAGTTSLAIAA